MKADDSSKHPKRGKFYKISEDKFWKKFKASAKYMQDTELKLRLQTCVNFISDPFIRNMVSWFLSKKYLWPIYSIDETCERHLQNVIEKDVEQNCISYVNETIVNEENMQRLFKYVRKLRTLQNR